MADLGTIARPYARALFDIAKAAGTLGPWSDALHIAASVVDDTKAKAFLANPGLTEEQRAGFVEVVAQDTPGGALWRSAEGRNLASPAKPWRSRGIPARVGIHLHPLFLPSRNPHSTF